MEHHWEVHVVREVVMVAVWECVWHHDKMQQQCTVQLFKHKIVVSRTIFVLVFRSPELLQMKSVIFDRSVYEDSVMV
jgi:hypothetical protein